MVVVVVRSDPWWVWTVDMVFNQCSIIVAVHNRMSYTMYIDQLNSNRIPIIVIIRFCVNFFFINLNRILIRPEWKALT